MNTYPWTLFFILLAAGLLATLAIIPYSVAMRPEVVNTLKEQLLSKGKRISPWLVIILGSTVQGGILVAIATFVGLLATRAIGLDLPILKSALAGQPFTAQLLRFLPLSILVGVLGGAAIAGLERYIFQPLMPEALKTGDARITFWKRVAACCYGGFVEEILLRLFVMSGLTWLLGLLWKSSGGGPALAAFWVANLLATLLFGAGHLPATRQLTPLTPLVVTRALVLNGLAGLMFGFLFIAYGLEAAIIAHFVMDIIIHLVLPAVKPLESGNAQAQTA